MDKTRRLQKVIHMVKEEKQLLEKKEVLYERKFA